MKPLEEAFKAGTVEQRRVFGQAKIDALKQKAHDADVSQV
jgi:hypothetical protein